MRGSSDTTRVVGEEARVRAGVGQEEEGKGRKGRGPSPARGRGLGLGEPCAARHPAPPLLEEGAARSKRCRSVGARRSRAVGGSGRQAQRRADAGLWAPRGAAGSGQRQGCWPQRSCARRGGRREGGRQPQQSAAMSGSGTERQLPGRSRGCVPSSRRRGTCSSVRRGGIRARSW